MLYPNYHVIDSQIQNQNQNHQQSKFLNCLKYMLLTICVIVILLVMAYGAWLFVINFHTPFVDLIRHKQNWTNITILNNGFDS